jgi:hypothetical protein
VLLKAGIAPRWGAVDLPNDNSIDSSISLIKLQEITEEQRLVELASRGLLILPRRIDGFKGVAIPNRGKLASDMIFEDRR